MEVTEQERENLARAKRIRDRLSTLHEEPKPPPRFRYFSKSRGPWYCWTVAKDEGAGDWYYSFTMKPTGKGARSGNAEEWTLATRSLVRHRKRKDAKARALRMFRAE